MHSSARRRPASVFVHIGFPATGTGVRRTLAGHRRRLSRQGVTFPASRADRSDGDDAQLDATLDLLDLEAPGRRSAGAWDRLAQGARDWRRGTVVLSHELLGTADPGQVARIVSSLGEAELHVVCTVRDLGRQIPHAWQRWVTEGGTTPFAGYVDRLVEHHRDLPSTVFWKAHSVRGLLEPWAGHVPTDRIHVLPSPQTDDPARGLWPLFARAVGIDARKMPAAPTPPLLPLAASEVARLLAIETGVACSDPVLELLHDVHGTLPAVAPRHQSWLAQAEQQMVDDVTAAGFDVVGDLADLVHAPGTLGASDQHLVPRDDDVIAVQTRLLAALG